MTDESLGYESSESPARPRRSAKTWVILLLAWFIGLLIWTVYIAAYVYVVIRVLT